MERVILLLVLLQGATSEVPQVINNITQEKQVYEENLSSSIRLDKADRERRAAWAVDLQVERVNLATKYRLQVTRHSEHSFTRPEGNAKWTECMFLHRRQRRRSEKQYYAAEGACLAAAAAGDAARTRPVELMERESRKWRKGYRYLAESCAAEHPADERGSAACLVQYMERDDYQNVIVRLRGMKIEAMGKLYFQFKDSLKELEECLNSQLSIYLEKVRLLMDTLNKCYSLTTQGDNNETK